jgi:hypothetical protein
MTTSTFYAPQIRLVELLEREKVQTTELPIYRDGGKVHPTSGTYTLYKPDNSKLVDGATVSIVGNVAQYTHAAADLPDTLTLGEGYTQEWSLVISGATYTFRRMLAIVKRRLYPVISDADLTMTYSDLEDLRPSTLESYQQYIDNAWIVIMNKIRQDGGGYPYLICSPEVFRQPHIDLSLYYIFRDFHSSLGQTEGRFLSLAQEHYKLYLDGLSQVNYIYDYDHDGTSGEANRRKGMQPVIYLNGSNTRSNVTYNSFGVRKPTRRY